MKRILSFLLIFSAGIYFPLSLRAQALTAEEIVKKVTQIMNPATSEGTMRMTITTTTGRLRTFEYKVYSKNHGEKTLMKYQQPARLRGQAILMLNNADDIWIYFPRTNRVRKLATHAKRQKMEGSDFSYEDMGAGNTFLTDFTAKLLGEEKRNGEKCYKLALTRKKGSSSSYSRLVLWVEKKSFVPVQIDYFDEHDASRCVKRLFLSEIETIDGIPTPKKMVMKNLLDNTQTVVEITAIRYDVPLSDALFTERGLKK